MVYYVLHLATLYHYRFPAALPLVFLVCLVSLYSCPLYSAHTPTHTLFTQSHSLYTHMHAKPRVKRLKWNGMQGMLWQVVRLVFASSKPKQA